MKVYIKDEFLGCILNQGDITPCLAQPNYSTKYKNTNSDIWQENYV